MISYSILFVAMILVSLTMSLNSFGAITGHNVAAFLPLTPRSTDVSSTKRNLATSSFASDMIIEPMGLGNDATSTPFDSSRSKSLLTIFVSSSEPQSLSKELGSGKRWISLNDNECDYPSTSSRPHFISLSTGTSMRQHAILSSTIQDFSTLKMDDEIATPTVNHVVSKLFPDSKIISGSLFETNIDFSQLPNDSPSVISLSFDVESSTEQEHQELNQKIQSLTSSLREHDSNALAYLVIGKSEFSSPVCEHPDIYDRSFSKATNTTPTLYSLVEVQTFQIELWMTIFLAITAATVSIGFCTMDYQSTDPVLFRSSIKEIRLDKLE